MVDEDEPDLWRNMREAYAQEQSNMRQIVEPYWLLVNLSGGARLWPVARVGWG